MTEYTWYDAGGTEYTGNAGDVPDDLEPVAEHRNDLGDWCPWSENTFTPDGTCPQFCREADAAAGFDAGDREQ